MGIYTSRYSNKELEDSKYYCVGISIGTPKFKLAYRLENQCYSLAPKGYMLRMGLEDFKKAYYEKLNGIGPGKGFSPSVLRGCENPGRLVSQNCFC